MGSHSYKTSLKAGQVFDQDSGTGFIDYTGRHHEIADFDTPVFPGTRVVENLLDNPDDFSGWANQNGLTRSTVAGQGPNGESVQQVTFGANVNSRMLIGGVTPVDGAARYLACVYWVKKVSAGTTQVRVRVNGLVSSDIDVGNEWTMVSASRDIAAADANAMLYGNAAGTTDDVYLLKAQYEDLTDQPNKAPNYEFVEGIKFYDDTNASYVDDGIVHPLVGAKIERRLYLGNNQTENAVLLGQDIVAVNVRFYILLDPDYTASAYAVGNDLDGSGRGYIRIDAGGAINVRGGGETVKVNGVVTSVLPLGQVCYVEVENIQDGYRIFNQLLAWSSWSRLKGSAWDFVFDSAHHYKGGTTDADWQDQIGSNHGAFTNGLPDTLPSQLWGYQNVPGYTNLLIDSDDMEGAGWNQSGVTYSTGPEGSPTGKSTTLTPAAGFAQHYCDAITVTENTDYTMTFWAHTSAARIATASAYDMTGTATIADLEYGSGLTVGEWKEIIFKFTTPASCVSVQLYPAVYADAQWDGPVSLSAVQCVEGDIALPYVPTTSGAVTTDNTELTETIADVVNEFEGEVVFRPMFNYDDDTAWYAIFVVSDGTTDNMLEVLIRKGDDFCRVQKTVGGVLVDRVTHSTSLTYTRHDQITVAAKATSAGIAINVNDLGWEWETDTAGIGDDWPAPLNHITYGGRFTSSGFALPGYIESSSYGLLGGSQLSFSTNLSRSLTNSLKTALSS